VYDILDLISSLTATPDMTQHLKDDMDDTKGRLRITKETERIHENTVEGYYQEDAEFNRLHSVLVSAEQVRLRCNPHNEIVPPSELRNSPTAMTESEANAEAAKRIGNILKRVRTRILQKGSGSKVK
jgi:hypothetical protein